MRLPALLLLLSFSFPSHAAAPEGEAFRNGMMRARWSSAVKQFLGTSYEAYDSKITYSGSSPTAPISRVWFTGGQGILTEIMWPTVDTPQVSDSQFLVSDGESFFLKSAEMQKQKWSGLGKAFRLSG
jgi:glucoamylase